jgi:protein-S-isoprenylcysteine O-methyltransferase Ste14
MGCVAIGCWIAYLLIAVVARAWLQKRRTGSTGLVGVGKSPIERLSGALFALSITLGVVGPVLDLSQTMDATDDAWVAGLALFVIALGLVVAAQLTMGASWRVGVDPAERTELVTDGPFSITRNPIFSAMILAQLGLVLIAPNAVAVAGWVLMIVALEVQVRLIEEPYLLRSHSDNGYSDYARRTGRFLPGFGRMK